MNREQIRVTTIPPEGPFLQFAQANASEFTGTMRLVFGSERLEVTWNSGYPGHARYYRNDIKMVQPNDAPAPWPLLLAFKATKGECSMHPGEPVGYPGFPVWELMRKGLTFKLGRSSVIDRTNGRRTFEVVRCDTDRRQPLSGIPAAEKLLAKFTTPLSVNQLLNKTDDPFSLAVDLELLNTLRLLSYIPTGASRTHMAKDKPADHILVLGRHLVGQRRWREAVTCLFRYRSPSQEVAALLSWSRFMDAPDDEYLKQKAKECLERAIRETPARVQYYAYLAAVHRLDGKYDEAERLLKVACEHSPNDESVLRELTMLRLRTPLARDFTPVKVRDYRAKIGIQRWIGGHSIVHTMRKDCCTLGSSATDDIIVSPTVCQRVLPQHCSITNEGGRYFIVRNHDSGPVFMNGRPMPIRVKTAFTHTDIVSLGARPPAGDIEFRLLELEMSSRSNVVFGDALSQAELNSAFDHMYS